MTNQRITFTDRELGLIGLAICKCDVLADMGLLKNPWCIEHDDDETTRILTKIARMQEEV